MPKLRHYDHLNTVRFVTFSTFRRIRLLTKPAPIEIFIDTLKSIREKHRLRIFGYVIMPEHVHLVLHPPQSAKLGLIIGELKSKSASRIITDRLVEFPEACYIRKDGRKRLSFWQPRCYDHNCRSNETIVEKIY